MGLYKLLSATVVLSLISSVTFAKQLQTKRKDVGYSTTELYNYFSLHPELKIIGPVYDQLMVNQDNKEAYWEMRKDYTKLLYGFLVTAAHDYMFERKEVFFSNATGEPKDVYWAMILSALAIPHHESRFMHFRNAEGSNCTSKLNTVKYLNNQVTSYWDNRNKKKAAKERSDKQAAIKNFLFNEKSPIIPQCDYLKYTGTINQLLIANTDVGLMQINMDQHQKFLEPDPLFNIYQHINYAINQWGDELLKLYNGIDSDYIIRNSEGKRICGLLSNPYPRNLDGDEQEPQAIVRLATALWSGKHNQGNIRLRSACRFKLAKLSHEKALELLGDKAGSLKNARVFAAYKKGYQKDLNFLGYTLYPLLGLKEYTTKEGSGKYQYRASWKSLLDTYLQQGSLESQSLKEIREQIASMYDAPGYEKVGKVKKLFQVARKYKQFFDVEGRISVDVDNLTPTNFKGDHFLNAKELKLYIAPAEVKYTYCGRVVPKDNEYLLLKRDESTETITVEKELPTGTKVSETWAKVVIPGLRSFKFEKSGNTNPLCEEKNLWALIKVGNESLLEKTGVSNLEDAYRVKLTDEIKFSLKVKKSHDYDSTQIGSLVKPQTPENGWLALEVYRSPYNTKYPVWVKVEYKPGKWVNGEYKLGKTGWVAGKFVERIN